MEEDLTLNDVLNKLPGWHSKLQEIREMILANAVMIGEIPSPTFGEEDRIRFISDRFTESGLQNISIDEAGNAIARIPGKKGDKTILLAAHADTVFDTSFDHAMSMGTETMSGPGIADNSLGVATIATIPAILEKLDIQLDADIILLATTKGLGKGDLGGIRFFLENTDLKITSAICLSGVRLGRLSYGSVGMFRGEITCQAPDEHDWVKYGSSGAISNLTKIIHRMLAIRTPREPQTSIILGSISGGSAYNTIATKALLKFEVRSEDGNIVHEVTDQIKDIVEEISVLTENEITLREVSKRNQGGIQYTHPLVKAVRAIMKSLDIQPSIFPSVGELSMITEKGIPCVTLGLTKGQNIHDPEELIEIEPIFTGITQLLGTMSAIDGGFCNED